MFLRLDLPQDVDVLQAPLSSPTSFMAGHCPLLTEEVVAMFENLLVSGKEAPDDQVGFGVHPSVWLRSLAAAAHHSWASPSSPMALFSRENSHSSASLVACCTSVITHAGVFQCAWQVR